MTNSEPTARHSHRALLTVSLLLVCTQCRPLGAVPPGIGRRRQATAGQAGGRASQTDAAADFAQLSRQAAEAQEQGESENGVRLYSQALKLRPGWADGWRNIGMLLADAKQYAKAEDAFRNLVRIEPKNGVGWALLGLTEYELGRDDDAYRDIHRGRTLGTRGADLERVAAYHAALIMIETGEFEIAHRHLLDVARGNVDDPDLTTALGMDALRFAMKPEKLDAQQKDLADRVGRIEYDATHAPAADVIAAYEKLIHALPREVGLHYAFGNFLIGAAHYDDGLAEMREELEVNPKDARAMLQIAMTYVRTDQPELALPYAQKAVTLAGDLFVSHYALGWTLYKLGQNDRAVPELEQTVKLAPDSAQAHYALSEAYGKVGRRADRDRERAIFARLKQEQADADQAAAAKGSAGGSPGAKGNSPPQP